jgi:putative transcriptional regulator
MKMKPKYTTIEQLDNEMAWTNKELSQIEKGAEKIRTRMHLREAREKAKLTQEELAKKAKIPRASISRIENGYRNVTINKLIKLADVMDMELEINFRPSK